MLKHLKRKLNNLTIMLDKEMKKRLKEGAHLVLLPMHVYFIENQPDHISINSNSNTYHVFYLEQLINIYTKKET